jgi:CheY-like chemotaxis protein
MSGQGNHDQDRGEVMSILVGAPDPALRERLVSTLRQRGHQVFEASNAQEMRARLAEHARRNNGPLDLVLCGGLLAEKEDPELAQRLASPGVTRALVLIPADGLLATATRAQRLAADAVVSEEPLLRELRELLERKDSSVHRSPGAMRPAP